MKKEYKLTFSWVFIVTTLIYIKSAVLFMAFVLMPYEVIVVPTFSKLVSGGRG